MKKITDLYIERILPSKEEFFEKEKFLEKLFSRRPANADKLLSLILFPFLFI